MNLKNIKNFYIAVPKDTKISVNHFLSQAQGFVFADKNTLKYFYELNKKELDKQLLIDLSITKMNEEDIFLIPEKQVYETYLIPKLNNQNCKNLYMYSIEELFKNDENFIAKFYTSKNENSEHRLFEYSEDLSKHFFHNMQGEKYDLERGKYWSSRFRSCGTNLRVAEGCRFINEQNISVGDDVYIGPNVTIEILLENVNCNVGNYTFIDGGSILLLGSKENTSVDIGSHCRIGYRTFINCGYGVEIMDYTRIGPNVNINNYNHNFDDLNKKIIEQDGNGEKTIIEGDCWIGTNATILGVRIEQGTVIGASSLVNKNVKSNQVFAGVPAKKIRERGKNEEI